MRVLCCDVCKRLAVLVFTDMDDRPHAPSPESSLYWFRKGTLKNPPSSRKEKRTQLPFLWSSLVIVYKSLKILHIKEEEEEEAFSEGDRNVRMTDHPQVKYGMAEFHAMRNDRIS